MIPFATMGQIQGATEYVWAAYIVTWLCLAGYTTSLWLRARNIHEESP